MTKPDDLPFPPAPAQRYACASLDWPSHFQVRGTATNPKTVRSPQRHYPTCSIEHMCTLPVRDFLLPDAFVFLWMTGPHLVDGAHVRLADAWGLRRSSMVFVWIKTKAAFDMGLLSRTPLLEHDLHAGTGYTTMANAEFVILLRKGQPKRLRAGIKQVIVSPVMEHSRKPEEFFRRAELYCAGPRLDMFAGAERPGWDAWGNPHRDGERAA